MESIAMSLIDSPIAASTLTASTLTAPIVAPPTSGSTRIVGSGRDLTLHLPVSCTHRQFHEWAISDQAPEHAKMYFIQGKASIDMSPDNIDFHNLVKTEIVSALHLLVRQSRKGLLLSDGCMFSHEATELTASPDGVFVSYDAMRAGRITASSASGKPGIHTVFIGAPDWVLEVVSASSPIKDLIERKQAYFAAGIPEYWIVDARQQELEFLILLRSADGYVVAERGDGWFHSTIFEQDFRLHRQRDEFGFWNYEVEQRTPQ